VKDEIHRPVLRETVVRLLSRAPSGTIVDATVGAGGHAEALLASRDDILLVGVDRDAEALAIARERLVRFGDRVKLVHGNYADLARILESADFRPIVGVLLDVGVSSLQLDDPDRGFSFRRDGPLDMRMDRSSSLSAADWLAAAPQEEIEDVLRRFGEERYAGRIARAIAEARLREALRTTQALCRVIHGAVPRAYFAGPIDPATRTFQAIRIRVNRELDSLERGLAAGFDALSIGGVLVVISFHSLEDRIAKEFLRERAAACVCPPDLPECVCGKRVEAEILTRRPIRADADEVAGNPRARSAKLRAARKVV
jgi:16S rRNA (cytosine1402-N4)-methyltransferase